ncbi:hypothetical protein HK104_008405 [Borealophlyctis nickersoniae]|nr:hypothetical protein HK104_008405 [Borealophlyctis nickersoniae]
MFGSRFKRQKDTDLQPEEIVVSSSADMEQEPPIDSPPSVSPETKASIFSLLIIGWMTPLIRKGYKRALEWTDLYPIRPDLDAEKLADAFEKEWEKQSRSGRKPRVWRIFYGLIARKFLPYGLLKYISDLSQVTSDPSWRGHLLAITAFIVTMVGSIAISFFFQRVQGIGMAVRGALTSVIYRKSLRLSGSARQEFNSGKITNIIATDCMRIDQFFTFFHLLWTFPIQIITIVALLLHLVGYTTDGIEISRATSVSALAGVALLVALIPAQAKAIQKMVQYRKSNATVTDARVKLTQEVLSGIRIVKMFAWEDSFLERILALRRQELVAVVRANVIRSAITALGFAVPMLAATVTYVVYAIVSPTFDAILIFSSMALFNQLRNPIMWSPMMLSVSADARVALKRIQALMEAPELDFEPEQNPEAKHAVEVRNGSFMWDSAPERSSDKDESTDKLNRNAKASVDPKSGVSSEDSAEDNNVLLNDSSSVMVQDLGDNHPAAAMSTVSSQLAASIAPEDEKEGAASDTFEDSPLAVPILKDVNISLPRGTLCAIVGPVGSGKSSLLAALIGQMKNSDPTASVVFSGSVGFCPQQAWIMNATVRDNITFGRPYDEARYKRCIDMCALSRDLEILPGGDMTEIGERGINLSGGQKQRVSVCRVAYFDPDIVLLDDPLSAVDAHVGRHIFEKCITGLLRGKTILLVTHQLHFVPQCDHVIVMKDGRVAEQGSYDSLIESGGEFCELMKKYGGVGEEDGEEEKKGDGEGESGQGTVGEQQGATSVPTGEDATPSSTTKPDPAKQNFVTAEERVTGDINNNVYLAYGRATGHAIFIPVLLFSLVLTQVTRIGSDLWLAFWTQQEFSDLSEAAYVGTFGALGVSHFLMVFGYAVLLAVGATRAARRLHENALGRVMRAPTWVFDTTPLGRIINRFSRDQDNVDNTLPDAIRLFMLTFAMAIATFILVACVTHGLFLIPLVPMMAVYYFIQKVYRQTSREIKRLDSNTRSPLYALITESINGVGTIRAYGEEQRFRNRVDSLVDTNNRPYYLSVTGQRWLGVRLETIGNVLMYCVAVLGVILRDSVAPGLFGLALTYILQVTNVLNLSVRQFTETEVQLNSVERLHYYATELDVEAAAETAPDAKPPQGWPKEGHIHIEGLELRYQKELPLVLKGVGADIRPREKIGVVGRTGSGKSSLTLGLFRIVEPCGGRITIDGIDISTLGLNDLRRALAIIPQDPVLFSGTIRSNLDPFGEHTDSELWEMLERSGMKHGVVNMEGKLDATVAVGGENLSVGQRQLMCLARAMLRKPKIIVLDECTANVDLATDTLIQKSLREDFADATVLTIAHRLNTVMDYDRILVLSAGKVVEFDTPLNLLASSGGVFAQMVANQ